MLDQDLVSSKEQFFRLNRRFFSPSLASSPKQGRSPNLQMISLTVKETRFQHHAFLFLCVCHDDLSFVNTTQKTLKLSKTIVSMPRMDQRKNFIPRNFSKRVAASASMRCKLLLKRFTGKTSECSKHFTPYCY